MAYEFLLLERPFPECARITLNRPQALNALSRGLRQELIAALKEITSDGQTRVAILTGAGRAFCAGLDLKEFGDGSAAPDDLLATFAAFPGPIIGAINGAAVTGGFEVAIACDVLLASTQARFADTHARVGVIPGWGLSQKLSRTIGLARAKELSLTGNFLSAEQALAWGLVNRVVEPAELLPQAEQLARDMLSVLPEMLTRYKRLIDDGYALPFGEAMALERQTSQAFMAELDPAAVKQRREGVMARGKQQTS